MRFPRGKAEGQSFYHCVSRVVDRRFIFETTGHGSPEAERFVLLMRRLEAFSGVRVLTYVLMSNHFHLLCEVPQVQEFSEAELLERIQAGYGPARRQALEQELAHLRQEPDGAEQIQRLLQPHRNRMFDLSIFIKERIVQGQSETTSWKEVSRQYRKYLFVHGSLNTKTKQPAFDLATAQTVVDWQNGELSLPERLRCRIRYFTDGLILGSQSFVESHFYKLKHKLGYKRRRRATRLTALGCANTLWVFRDLRVRPIG